MRGAGCSFVWHTESNSRPPGGSTPRARHKHAACIYDCRVYVFGGRDGNLPLKDLWRFDLKRNTWENLKWTGDRIPNLQEHSMVPYQNKIYIFGGNFQFGADPDIPFWILDLERMVCRKQKVVGAVPEGRRGHTAVAFKDSMYIFAGFIDMRRSSNELWSFNFTLDQWSLLEPVDGTVPVGRHGHSAAVYQRFMCVYGGLADLETKDDLWLWDFDARRWTRVKCPRGPPSLEGHSACVTRNLMILYGGSHDGVLQNDLWAFDFDLEAWQKLTCKGVAQVPCSKHAALLTFHSDWCCRPSCVDSTLNLRRAASCPSSSVVVAQRGTRLTSSSRPFSEKDCPQLSYCPRVGAAAGCLDHRSATLRADEMALGYQASKPVLSREDIFCRSSAKLESVPLILASDTNSCSSLGVANPAAMDSLQLADEVPIRSNGLSEPDGFRAYPGGKSHCDADSSLIIRVPEVSETKMVPDSNGSFPKTANASVLSPRIGYSEDASKEETESKSRHVLAVSLLGTPNKSKTSLNRSFSGDGFNKPELPLESGSPLLVEMNHFGGEMRPGGPLSGKNLVLQDLENLESGETTTVVNGDGSFPLKATEEMRQFVPFDTGCTLTDQTEDRSCCLTNRNIKEAWVSPSHSSSSSTDHRVSREDDVVISNEYQPSFERSSNSSPLTDDDQLQCPLELFEAKTKQPSCCPEFCMFVLGGRSMSSATNFEVQTISMSRLEISLGSFPNG